jgi:hypothetical protein
VRENRIVVQVSVVHEVALAPPGFSIQP